MEARAAQGLTLSTLLLELAEIEDVGHGDVMKVIQVMKVI
jgi:hypothetical protein